MPAAVRRLGQNGSSEECSGRREQRSGGARGIPPWPALLTAVRRRGRRLAINSSHARAWPGQFRLRTLLAVLVGLVIVAAAVGVVLAVARGGPGSTARGASSAGRPMAGSPRASGPAGFPGRYGVEARWVIEENKRPGTTAWRISGAGGGIAGFASRTDAAAGQHVTLYVSTAAPTFRAEAFRMGYYQGTGARLVWQSAALRGRVLPPCPVRAGVNIVSCDNWTASLTFAVSPAFVQGDYLIKLVGSGGQQSYVPLTVWDPASTSAYLVKNDVYTWQAWNPYGGYDFYQGLGSCPPDVYPLCSRARMVSFDRPYGAEQGSGNFLTLEYPLVYFAEEHGLDVSYATDITVEQHPAILLRHRAVLSLGHDECWSLTERQAAVTAHDDGVNIVFFAASPILRHVRMAASPLGPDRVEIDYRDSAADPLDGKGNPLEVTGNTWSSAPANWPEYDFVGETYAGFLEPGLHASLVVADASAWIFRGTGLHDGSAIPGVIASDVDSFYPANAHPSDLQVLSRSPIPASLGQSALGTFSSDMTYYTDPSSGAGVLDTGTNNWIPALTGDRDGCPAAATCAAMLIQRITGNVLLAFGEGPTGHGHPSAANWRAIAG